MAKRNPTLAYEKTIRLPVFQPSQFPILDVITGYEVTTYTTYNEIEKPSIDILFSDKPPKPKV